MPFAWNSTAQPRMCTCPKVSLSWECHRCGKINAPWKGSCNCTPSPLSGASTSIMQPHTGGPINLNHHFTDEV
jgi:hypothetical protein